MCYKRLMSAQLVGNRELVEGTRSRLGLRGLADFNEAASVSFLWRTCVAFLVRSKNCKDRSL